MAILVFAVVLAMILGFAAHRASICTVRTIAEIMSARTGYMLASVGKSVLWVWAVTIPIFWLMPALGTGISGWSLTGYAMLGGLLFGVRSGDPVTFIGMGTLLIAVAAVAGYIPAWRASRIDPMVALRSN